MGFLARIMSAGKSSNNQSSLSTGGHAIDKNVVLSPTDPTVITPMNAGSWETVRTAQVNHSPRYFTKEEADQIRAIAKGASEGARHTQRAYRGLRRIEEADAAVHKHHRNYIRGVADAELTKKRADASTARHLHRQRPEYAKLGFGLDKAEDKANQRIEELKRKIKAAK
ncbi:hypothetical protein [Calothrix sp. NIES-2098]|uniref:hypothetical protein n=1 Tax=Calothrix sp. NIES-2098 TaxID=1954171 RepID=UPI000B60C34A|nr:hypothetical protein NIES2098_34550 [Calothrix sp. NIES-2098]